MLENKKLTLNITHPELCKEWHPTKNGDKTPDQFTYGSGEKIWWICKDDNLHEWKSCIFSRTRSNGCPYCGINRQKQTRKNNTINGVNLTITNPLLLEEWHPTNNIDKKPEHFTRGSGVKVYWICKNDSSHEWECPIKHRAGKNNTIKTGCPYCCGQKASSTNNLTITHPELCKEWHQTKNENKMPKDFTYGSEKKVWWICNEDPSHEWEAIINNRTCHHNGCPYCNGKVSDSYNLTITNPDLVKEWDYIKNGDKKPEQFSPGSNEKIWWQCVKYPSLHKWEASINNRTCKNKRGCPYCSCGFGEKFVKYVFEKIFKRSFPKIRPDFLKNPETGYNLELDGFCEELMIAFEYQGRQHEEIVPYFKMDQEELDRRKLYDQFKRNRCKEYNIKLIEIPEFDYSFPKEDVKQFIVSKCIELNVDLPLDIDEIEISYYDFITSQI